MRDTSLRVPPGVAGTVVEVRVFTRHGVEKDERAMAIEREEIERLAKDRDDEMAILERNIYARLQEMLDRPGRAEAAPKGVKAGAQDHRGDAATSSAAASGGRSRSTTTGRCAEIEAINAQFDDAVDARSSAASRTRSRSCSAATSCRRAS